MNLHSFCRRYFQTRLYVLFTVKVKSLGEVGGGGNAIDLARGSCWRKGFLLIKEEILCVTLRCVTATAWFSFFFFWKGVDSQNQTDIIQ